MSIYQDLQKQLPRELKKSLSSLRGYANDKLGFFEFKTQLNERFDLTKIERRKHFDAKVAEVDHLAIILFTYALYLNFTNGDKAIKNAVSMFEELEIRSVKIGALELSRNSKYYNMGKMLAEELFQSVQNADLKAMFVERVPFHIIADRFQRG